MFFAVIEKLTEGRNLKLCDVRQLFVCAAQLLVVLSFVKEVEMKRRNMRYFYERYVVDATFKLGC